MSSVVKLFRHFDYGGFTVMTHETKMLGGNSLYGKGLRYMHTHGLLSTGRRFIYLLYRETFVRFMEWRFDHKLGVQTAGVVNHPTDSANPLHRLAAEYQGTSPAIFQKIMRSIGCLTAPYVFYDIGCGKGRVLLMAAAQRSFKRVVGIEFVPELARVAEDNISCFRAKNPGTKEIEVACGDAAQYRFPDEDAVFFFFNPFQQEIMTKVLENIRLSAKSSKHRYIIYYNPVLAHLLSEPEKFALIAKEKKYSIYRIHL